MAKTKLSKQWTTVTPLSKMFALGMLVILPFIGAYVGYKLRDKAYVKPSPVELARTGPMMSGDSKSETIRRCGDIPREELGVDYGHFTIVDGPVWAPDCRHIAWSVWQSGTGV